MTASRLSHVGIPHPDPGRAALNGRRRKSKCQEDPRPRIRPSRSARLNTLKKATRSVAFGKRKQSAALGPRSTNPAAEESGAVQGEGKRRTRPRRAKAAELAAPLVADARNNRRSKDSRRTKRSTWPLAMIAIIRRNRLSTRQLERRDAERPGSTRQESGRTERCARPRQ